MRLFGTIAVGTLLVLLTFGAGGAQPVSPLVVDWDQFFTVEARPDGVAGRSAATVSNTSGWGASRIQMLVEALDAAGRPVDQRVVWLGADLPAGARTYFEAPVAAAAAYRVRVFAFELGVTSGPR